jgi:hypothetical protein
VTKLKLGPLADDKPVKITVEIPASLHRDLTAYADALGRANGQNITEPSPTDAEFPWPELRSALADIARLASPEAAVSPM